VRQNSDTFGKWESYIISEKTRDHSIWFRKLPRYALTDCIFHYNLFYTGAYVDENKQGVIKWNDLRFNIEMPIYPHFKKEIDDKLRTISS
jgi:dTDP-4-dehydrorhamnose 3,5-epimerase-like enzyme